MTPYQKYQLEWMLAHDKSLSYLISEIDLTRQEIEDESTGYTPEPTPSINELFDMWQYNEGFAGEIWVCEDEFNESLESKPALNAAVLPITLDILNDAIANLIGIDEDAKDLLTTEDYQHIATTAAEATFNNEVVMNPVLEALYANISNAAEKVLANKQTIPESMIHA